MLSAVISSERGQPAMPLAGQLAHQRFVHLGPLVLETGPLKTLSRVEDRDRTVSRRSEPSSRASLMGEQPNPWDLLQPQDGETKQQQQQQQQRTRRQTNGTTQPQQVFDEK